MLLKVLLLRESSGYFFMRLMALSLLSPSWVAHRLHCITFFLSVHRSPFPYNIMDSLRMFFLFGFSWKLQILAFSVCVFDKLVAKRIVIFNLFQRIPENFFYFVAFIGGSPGLILSFYLLNHKVGKRKQSFRMKVIAAAVLAPFLNYAFSIV